MLQLEYRHKDEKKALAFTEKLEQKILLQENIKSYLVLRSTTTFKKNNSYHTSIIIK